MNLYSINGDLLYSTRQPTLARALAEAVRAGVHLGGINLRRARLRGARLDGLTAPRACLWGADLTGCDLADADLAGADARMATFIETCLVDALCVGGLFEGAYFRHVLLDGADFSDCAFSCPSILAQPLHLCRSMERAVYWHRGEEACPLDGGIVRLSAGGYETLALGGRLIVNGALAREKFFTAGSTTESSKNPPFFAHCDDL